MKQYTIKRLQWRKIVLPKGYALTSGGLGLNFYLEGKEGDWGLLKQGAEDVDCFEFKSFDQADAHCQQIWEDYLKQYLEEVK